MSVRHGELCRPTAFLDYESPSVRTFRERVGPEDGRSERELAVELYYAVRDGIQYEIYGADLSREGMRASQVVSSRRGLCIHKSVLYAACLRAVGIPSRLVFFDVRNHLASARLTRLLGGDVFCYHCVTELYLGGRWIRATPVFNAKLCVMYRITPLEFDGEADSVLHAYDDGGRAFMEVVHRHGAFDDLPYELVIGGLTRAHPTLLEGPTRIRKGSLRAEAGSARRPHAA
jgi:transglutaminase-like putative cysteine protease